MVAILLVASFILGTLIGSFLNVLILRLPRGESIQGRSHCPRCKATLKPWHLVPVISYIALGGKCARCQASISPRYALIELLTGILFALLAWVFYPTTAMEAILLVRAWFIVSILIVVFVVDWEEYLILDRIVFPAVGVTLALNILIDLLGHYALLGPASYTSSGILGALVISGFFWLIWRLSNGQWMGYGDVKLGLFLGVALGFSVGVFCLFLSFLLGTVVSVPLLVLGRKRMNSAVPFGTFLSVACLISLLFGQQLVAWYLRLIGMA